MKRLAFPAILALLTLAAPAQATGGLECRTAGDEATVIQLGFGHVPNAGLFLARLVENGREIAVEAPQWWMEGRELRLALRHADRFETALVLKAEWNEEAHAYDGAIHRDGKQRWVRCREA